LIYLEHIPAGELGQNVRTLWYTRAPQIPHTRERILPNGCVQIIINLARDFILDCPEDGTPQRIAPALVVGARSVYEIVDTSDMAELMGIIFEAGGFAPFASDAVDRFSNKNCALEDLWGNSARGLRDRLREAVTPANKFRVLEDFLTKKFSTRLDRNRAVDFALSEMKGAAIAPTVKAIAEKTGWSERRFSQIFREQVGLSPKVWCRIQRFQWAVKQLHRGADLAWADLALECGYYDQAHFANEFRAFSGVDATSYSARRTRWTNHIPAG
jgi:AraC-like DNA-binding protein